MNRHFINLTNRLTHYNDSIENGAVETEDGFEIAQAMGIALLGLVVTAGFATALEAVGVDVISGIRSQLGL